VSDIPAGLKRRFDACGRNRSTRTEQRRGRTVDVVGRGTRGKQSMNASSNKTTRCSRGISQGGFYAERDGRRAGRADVRACETYEKSNKNPRENRASKRGDQDTSINKKKKLFFQVPRLRLRCECHHRVREHVIDRTGVPLQQKFRPDKPSAYGKQGGNREHKMLNTGRRGARRVSTRSGDGKRCGSPDMGDQTCFEAS